MVELASTWGRLLGHSLARVLEQASVAHLGSASAPRTEEVLARVSGLGSGLASKLAVVLEQEWAERSEKQFLTEQTTAVAMARESGVYCTKAQMWERAMVEASAWAVK